MQFKDYVLDGAIADLEEALKTIERNKSNGAVFTKEEIECLLNLLKHL